MPEIDILKTQFEDYCVQHNKEIANVLMSIKAVSKEVSLIKDNHLTHLKEDIFEIKGDISVMKNNQKWMMMLGGGIGGVISGIVMAAINNLI